VTFVVWIKAFGVLLIVAGACVATVSYDALSDVEGRAKFIAEVGRAFDHNVDQQMWASRWRASSLLLAAVATGAIASGVVFLGRPKAGWLTLAATLLVASAMIATQRWLRPTVYTFELEWWTAVICFTVACPCFLAARSRRFA
jgi:anti-sigma-K factor RskA